MRTDVTGAKRLIVSQTQTHRLKSNPILAIVFLCSPQHSSLTGDVISGVFVYLWMAIGVRRNSFHKKKWFISGNFWMAECECDAKCETKLITNGWIGINKPKSILVSFLSSTLSSNICHFSITLHCVEPIGTYAIYRINSVVSKRLFLRLRCKNHVLCCKHHGIEGKSCETARKLP